MRFQKEVNIFAEGAILKRFQAAETNLGITNGKIHALITESELVELTNGKATMYSRLAETELSVHKLGLDFSDVSSKYDTVTGQYTELDSKLAQYEIGLNGIKVELSSVKVDLKDNYATVLETNAIVKAGIDEFSGVVSKTYATTDRVSQAQKDAVNAANSKLTETLKNYSTTAQMRSEIKSLGDSLTLSVQGSYVTKTAFAGAEGRIGELESWKKSADLKISDDAIVSTVRKSQAYKSDMDGVVKNTELESKIEQWFDRVTITAAKIKLEGLVTVNQYFKIHTDGSMESIKGRIGGFEINEKRIYSSNTDGTYAAYFGSYDFNKTNAFVTQAKVGDSWVNTIEMRYDGSVISRKKTDTNVRVTLADGGVICQGSEGYGTTVFVELRNGEIKMYRNNAPNEGAEFVFTEYGDINTGKSVWATQILAKTETLNLGGGGEVTLQLEKNAIMANANLNMRGNSVINSSDARLKTDILPLCREVLPFLMSVSVASYTWKTSGEKVPVGLIAQDVRQYFPDLVVETGEYLGIKTTEFIPYLIKGLQEMNCKIGEKGHGILNESGECMVFSKDMPGRYFISLTKYGIGDIYVVHKDRECFLVRGTPGLEFDWTASA